jgi:hypothetical protein
MDMLIDYGLAYRLCQYILNTAIIKFTVGHEDVEIKMFLALKKSLIL